MSDAENTQLIEIVEAALLRARSRSETIRFSTSPTVQGPSFYMKGEHNASFGLSKKSFTDAAVAFVASQGASKPCKVKATWNTEAIIHLFEQCAENGCSMTLTADFSKHSGNVFKAEAHHYGNGNYLREKLLATNAEKALSVALGKLTLQVALSA